GADEIEPSHPLVERVLLGAQADVTHQRRIIPHRLAEDADLSLARIQLAGCQLEQRRLAGAVGTEQARHAGWDAQRQLVQPNDVAVPLGDAVELDDRRHLSRSSDFMRRLRIHTEIPIRPARTAPDHHQGYCGTIWSASRRSLTRRAAG